MYIRQTLERLGVMQQRKTPTRQGPPPTENVDRIGPYPTQPTQLNFNIRRSGGARWDGVGGVRG